MFILGSAGAEAARRGRRRDPRGHPDLRDPSPGPTAPAIPDPSPGPTALATRADRRGRRRPVGAGHAVMVVVAEWVSLAGEHGAGEEHDRDHENDPGDDHDPRRDLIEPVVLCRERLRPRGWAGRRLGFRCLGHDLIMPRRAPAINQPRSRVAAVLRPEHPGELQADHQDERDPRDDRHPGGQLVKPLGIGRRCDDGRRRARRRGRRLVSLAHTSHNASGQHRPRGVRPGCTTGEPTPERRSPAPPSGRRAHGSNAVLRLSD